MVTATAFSTHSVRAEDETCVEMMFGYCGHIEFEDEGYEYGFCNADCSQLEYCCVVWCEWTTPALNSCNPGPDGNYGSCQC